MYRTIHCWLNLYKLLGFLLFVGGGCLNGLGISGVPEAVAAMLLVTQVVWNAVWCFILLKEKPLLWDYVGTALILGGAGLALAFGPVNPHPCESFNEDLIRFYFSSPPYVAFSVIQVGFHMDPFV